MKAYWWNVQPNFGDYLSTLVFAHYSGIDLEWASPAEAEIVGIGSNLDVLPANWSGIIAGSGKLHEDSQVPSRGKVWGVRGHLTAEGLRGTFAIGDPGLLVDELIGPEPKVHNLGLVPHWTDWSAGTLAKRFAHLDPYVIDPRQDPLTVVREIARCKKIVASSLHGLVVADAFGIPRRAEIFPKMTSPHEGGDFKFRDYSSALDMPMEWGVLQSPSRLKVNHVQAELFDMVTDLGVSYGVWS